MKRLASLFLWLAVALLGVGAYFAIATHTHERLNSSSILIAALCTYAIGYRFYSKWIAATVLALDDRRATPCEIHEDGKDFVTTNKWIVFGHHFAAISGPGPLVGPVLAAQFGYLPGTLWILIGVALGGAVQDFIILTASMRRNGRSLGGMLRDELNSAAGVVGTIAILAIMIILLAVLALVVVNALAESPWGVFTVAATIPIAMFMGGYLRSIRVGKVLEASVIGVVLLLLAVWGGQFIYSSAHWAPIFTVTAPKLAWAIIAYGLAASVLPCWLLLAPRDYLSTFMKLGTILALAGGCFLVLPDLQMPALTKFIDGSGPVVPGKLFPFCFITIACGAISGFHTLIASGLTPKIITRETYARPIGYGAMCLESLVAIMALIAACTLEPGVYLAINVKGTPAQVTALVESSGLEQFDGKSGRVPATVSEAQMKELAAEVGEPTLYGRTGGAATLAVGMAHIFGGVFGKGLLAVWYHFALMFEALFILTTLDAGTRVGRYLVQDALGHVWKPLGNASNLFANIFASALIVAGWGFFLLSGVADPAGGTKALWPIFGIANQLLAAIALCLATTILIKMQLTRQRTPALALVTLLPLAWLLTVTTTAGVQKVWDQNPKIGFLAGSAAAASDLIRVTQASSEQEKAASASQDISLIVAAQKNVNEVVLPLLKKTMTTMRNNIIDACATIFFLVLVAAIVLISLYEWWRLLYRNKPAQLSETPPVWIPADTLAPSAAAPALGVIALSLALLKEVSGEAALDRAQLAAAPHSCTTQTPRARRNTYLTATEARYRSIRTCC